jgi:hypothetical protein
MLPVTVLRGVRPCWAGTDAAQVREPALPHAPDSRPSSSLHKGDAALSVHRLDALKRLKRFRKGCEARTVDEATRDALGLT